MASARTITDDDVALHKARAIAQLAPGLAHDLINQVGGISQFLPLVTGQLEERDARMLRDSADRALETVTAFQQLVRTRATGSRPERLDRLVDSVRTLVAYDLQPVTVTVDLPADPPEVDGVPADLRQAILAVLLDRLAAMGAPPAGRLRFVAAEAPAGATVAELAIEDDGPTSAPDSVDIAVARHLLERSGGALREDSPPGGGSRVVLAMRLAGVGEDPREAGHRTQASAPADSGTTALICDDDASLRSLISRVLLRDGIVALEAATGEAALEVLATTAVDVVLADHHMGGMTGSDLYLAAVERYPALRDRFVLMSGDAGASDFVAFARDRGIRIVEKPFTVNMADVVRAVARA